MLKCLTLTLKIVPNVAKCLNTTFYFGCDIHGWRYAQMPHPNPKSCSKCHKMLKYNFLFWGACSWLRYAQMPCPKYLVTIFHFGCDMLGGGYSENPPPQPENSDFQMSI